jgi:hypothetical protein
MSRTATEIAGSRTATEVAVSRTEAEIAVSGLEFQPFGAMAVSGAAGQCRLPTDTNRPPIGMSGRHGRQKTVLMAMRIEMPSNPGHSRSNAPRLRLLRADRCRGRCKPHRNRDCRGEMGRREL